MRTFLSIIIPALLVSVFHLVYAQDCDLVQEQACCYAEIDNGSDTSYCCNGSIVGNPSSSKASALNDLTCCQDDGRTGISVGFSTSRPAEPAALHLSPPKELLHRLSRTSSRA